MSECSSPTHGKGGRPSLYQAAFCEKVVEWGAQGKSRTWMAAEIGVSRECIYEWARVHQEFSDALARAEALSQKWWEDAGQQNLTSRDFNSSVWSRSMAARFPKDWREKNALVGGDDEDAPINMKITDADAFTRRIASLAARASAPSAPDGTE